jgi:hypothetical protein
MNEYPRLHHDEKKCSRITLEKIEMMKESYKKHKNYRLVGRIFHVTHSTVAMYVKGDEYRKKLISDSIKRQKMRMLNPEYKKKYLALRRKRRKERIKEDPLFEKYCRLQNSNVIHKNHNL